MLLKTHTVPSEEVLDEVLVEEVKTDGLDYQDASLDESLDVEEKKETLTDKVKKAFTKKEAKK